MQPCPEGIGLVPAVQPSSPLPHPDPGSDRSGTPRQPAPAPRGAPAQPGGWSVAARRPPTISGSAATRRRKPTMLLPRTLSGTTIEGSAAWWCPRTDNHDPNQPSLPDWGPGRAKGGTSTHDHPPHRLRPGAPVRQTRDQPCPTSAQARPPRPTSSVGAAWSAGGCKGSASGPTRLASATVSGCWGSW